MKVRWTSESLRLRITPTEMEALERGEALAERLGGWDVRLDPGGEAIGVTWDAATATVACSAADVARLAEPDREGIYAHGDGFRLLVEKDYPCVHPQADQAQEPETERFEPSPGFVARKDAQATARGA